MAPNIIKRKLEAALALSEFTKCSSVSLSVDDVKEILKLLNSYRELKIQFEALDAECSRLEKKEWGDE